jgi:integrase
MRVSEVLGLTWRHLDFERGLFLVRQRYHRGDLDVTKTEDSSRDRPIGHLAEELARMYPGEGTGR